MKDPSMPGTADTTSLAGSSLSQANSAGGSSSETGVSDSATALFLRAQAASEENEEEILSPPATEMTTSFSSNGTTRETGTVVARSAVGTDLSDSKTAVV
ncbi:hypothetical protein PR002_g12391 [Phytophthora rubi]|uniref:Uncharacterized protein n=1 Tax=Phytophthora rubi TaxID=129364 RepID=A0A6A3LNP3_9STRA|nr:hypothetical protein PR002_g12391 [Phytophthora rubi]